MKERVVSAVGRLVRVRFKERGIFFFFSFSFFVSLLGGFAIFSYFKIFSFSVCSPF